MIDDISIYRSLNERASERLARQELDRLSIRTRHVRRWWTDWSSDYATNQKAYEEEAESSIIISIGENSPCGVDIRKCNWTKKIVSLLFEEINVLVVHVWRWNSSQDRSTANIAMRPSVRGDRWGRRERGDRTRGDSVEEKGQSKEKEQAMQ